MFWGKPGSVQPCSKSIYGIPDVLCEINEAFLVSFSLVQLSAAIGQVEKGNVPFALSEKVLFLLKQKLSERHKRHVSRLEYIKNLEEEKTNFIEAYFFLSISVFVRRVRAF